MEIRSVTYKGIFRTSNADPYLNEHIQIEIALNEGDSVQDALDLARKEAKENHQRNNAGLYINNNGVDIPFKSTEMPAPVSGNHIAQDKILPTINYRERERWEVLIDSATTLAELEQHGLCPMEVAPSYNKKWEELEAKRKSTKH